MTREESSSLEEDRSLSSDQIEQYEASRESFGKNDPEDIRQYAILKNHLIDELKKRGIQMSTDDILKMVQIWHFGADRAMGRPAGAVLETEKGNISFQKYQGGATEVRVESYETGNTRTLNGDLKSQFLNRFPMGRIDEINEAMVAAESAAFKQIKSEGGKLTGWAKEADELNGKIDQF